MFKRRMAADLGAAFARSPVALLIGPRQVGKTTLAHALAAERLPPPAFLDLERPADRARLADPEAALCALDGSLVVLDEIRRATAPSVPRGFHIACDDVDATARWVVYPGREAYRGPHGVEVLPVVEAMRRLRG